MRNTYIIAILALSLSWGQGLSGLAGKAKEKLQAVEKDIKNTFAKLEVKTDSEFVDNSTKYDFDKRTLTSPDRDRVFKETKKDRFYFDANTIFKPNSIDSVLFNGC